MSIARARTVRGRNEEAWFAAKKYVSTHSVSVATNKHSPWLPASLSETNSEEEDNPTEQHLLGFTCTTRGKKASLKKKLFFFFSPLAS